MAVVHSDVVPGLGGNLRTLVAELRGRCVRTFVARDEQDAAKLFVVEHLTLDGAAKSGALGRVSVLTSAPNPRLTRIRGAVERAGGIDVVSDFIDGELVHEVEARLRTSGTPIPTLCTLRLISDVLAGLHTLHGIPEFASSGHGKLSPRTAVVGLDGRVRLIELVRENTDSSGDSEARFVAPEILAGGPPSPRGDIYAAGAMLAALLESGDEHAADEVRPIRAVAERAVASEPGDRFESAAAMLSALASTFRGAPSHADVARLMAATAGEQIRARRAAAEKAPILADAEVRHVLAPPPSMPVVFAAEPLPGSRRASSWPSALQADSGPPSSLPFLGTAPPSSSPPSSRRTDRPPPGFGSAPASGMPLPLGFTLPLAESSPAASSPAASTASTAPASTPALATAPTVEQKVTKQQKLTAPMPKPTPASVGAIPASRAATPSAPAVRAAPPARSSTPSVAAAKAASSSASAAPPVRATAVVAAPVAPAPPAPPPVETVAAPASVPSIPAIASTHPNPETSPDSRATDSWRYASAKPVEPPRRAVTLPVPDESIIVQGAGGADEDRTVKMMSPPSAPPSVRHISSAPPGSSTSSKLPAIELRAPAAPRKPASKLVPMALAGLAFFGLATGGFALRARNKSTAESPSAAAVPRTATPPAVVAAVAGAAASAAAEKRCPDGTVLIEGGVFTMGTDAPDASTGAKPAHSVTLSAFCMDAVEVSVAKFKECSDHGDCKRGLVTNDWTGITPAEHAAYEPLCTLRDPVGMASHPINCVDWERADIYCTARNSRLPTEAEWELAARGRDNRAYPWGDDSPSPTLVNACGAECMAWAGKNAFELTASYDGTDSWLGTAPGKTFPAGATPEGIADLAGNVAEWVADAYAPYTAAAQTNPVVPNGDLRVVRGGSFITGKRAALATTYRSREKPTKRSSTIGFRCVSPPGAPVAGR